MAVIDVSLPIIELLRTAPTVTNAVGSNIFFDRMPQSIESSALCIWTVSAVGHMDLSGPVGLDQDVMQFDAYAKTRGAANCIASVVWQRLAGKQGVTKGVHIKGITRSSGGRMSFDRVKTATQQVRFVVSQDLLISYDSLNSFGE